MKLSEFDYVITTVGYNEKRSHIRDVEIWKVSKKESIVDPDRAILINKQIIARSSIISWIIAGKKITSINLENKTCCNKLDNKNCHTPKIDIVRINGVEYIKTIPNGCECDSLENLSKIN